MEILIEEHRKLIAACADMLCRRYRCPQLREDLISVGNLVLLQRAGRHDMAAGASMSTYLYPYLLGAMRRQIEKILYPIVLPKDIFAAQGALWQTAFSPLEEYREKADTARAVAQQVITEICLACLKEQFALLSFKERHIIGGFFGAYDFPKQTLADLAEEFQMTESALGKAKDKAIAKLRRTCEESELGVWRDAQKQIREAQRECSASGYFSTQSQWYLSKQKNG